MTFKHPDPEAQEMIENILNVLVEKIITLAMIHKEYDLDMREIKRLLGMLCPQDMLIAITLIDRDIKNRGIGQYAKKILGKTNDN